MSSLFSNLPPESQREELDILEPRKRRVSHAQCRGGDTDCPVCAGFVDEVETEKETEE